MLVGGRVAFEKKNLKILLHFDDRKDITLKHAGFALACVADAESLVTDADIKAEAEREIGQKRDAIEAAATIPPKEKEKAISNLSTGEVVKRMQEKARARLVYIKGQELSRERFLESVAKLERCFTEIATLAGAMKE